MSILNVHGKQNVTTSTKKVMDIVNIQVQYCYNLLKILPRVWLSK